MAVCTAHRNPLPTVTLLLRRSLWHEFRFCTEVTKGQKKELKKKKKKAYSANFYKSHCSAPIEPQDQMHCAPREHADSLFLYFIQPHHVDLVHFISKLPHLCIKQSSEGVHGGEQGVHGCSLLRTDDTNEQWEYNDASVFKSPSLYTTERQSVKHAFWKVVSSSSTLVCIQEENFNLKLCHAKNNTERKLFHVRRITVYHTLSYR